MVRGEVFFDQLYEFPPDIRLYTGTEWWVEPDYFSGAVSSFGLFSSSGVLDVFVVAAVFESFIVGGRGILEDFFVG